MAVDVLILIFGSFAGACSIVFIKASTLNPILLAAYRQLFAVVILAPVFISAVKKSGRKLTFAMIKPSILPGVLLGLHFIAWNMGARRTLAANGTLLVNMVPVVMPLFAFLFYREVVNLFEIIGTAVAMTGMVLLGITDFHTGRETFVGDMLCFVSMILAAVYLALGRRSYEGTGESLWIYIIPLYFTGGAVCFIVSLFFTGPGEKLTLFNILMAGGLAAVSTVGGHTIYNRSMRKLRSQLVTLVNLSQVIFGAILGFLFFNEMPSGMFYLAAPVILAGTVLAVVFSNRKRSGEIGGKSAGI